MLMIDLNQISERSYILRIVNMRIPALLLILFPLTAFADRPGVKYLFPPLPPGVECTDTGQINFLSATNELLVKSAKVAALAAVKENLKTFCEWNRMDRYLDQGSHIFRDQVKNSPFKTHEVLKKRMEFRYRQAKDAGNLDLAANIFTGYLKENASFNNDVWTNSLLGHEKLKLAYVTSFFYEVKRNAAEEHSMPSLAASMVESLEAPFLQDNTYSLPKYSLTKPMPAIGMDKKAAACAYLSFTAAADCIGAVEALEPYVSIYQRQDSKYMVAPLPLIKKALADRTITEGLKTAATNIWKKVRDDKFGPTDNVFDELKSAFILHGMEPKLAAEKALLSLGAISSGGPNFVLRGDQKQATRFPNSCSASGGCNPNFIYLSAIAEGMVHGDTYKMRAEKPSLYSLPAQHSFPCDSGKTYHFWSMAALTHEMMKQDYSAEGARAAVYLSQLGYQMHRPIQSDDQKTKLLEKARFGTLENSTRIDLTLAAAGTRFGADISQGKDPSSHDLSKGLYEMIRDGGERPNEQKNSTFLFGDQSLTEQWVDDLAPGTAFSQY